MPTLSTVQKAGYGFGDFGYNLIWQAATLFLIFFYTDIAGLSPEWAGFIFGVGSIWDAITDPIMGGIADRTRSRAGRYRPYILWAAAPLALLYWISFSVPSLTGPWLIAWALVTHFLLRTAFTVSNIPYSSLTARMTSDANERASLTGWRMQFATGGGLTLAVVLPPLVVALGGGDAQYGWSAAVAVLALVFFVSQLVSYYLTSEPPEGQQEAQADVSFSPAALFKDIISVALTLRLNGPLARVFAAIIIGGGCLAMFGKNVPYYFKYVYGDETLMNQALGLFMLCQILIIPFYVWFSARTSKLITWLTASGVMGFGLLLMYLNTIYSQPIVFAIFALTGLGAGGLGVMFWSMLPDTVEYNEWATGERNEAKVYAFATFGTKMASGVAGFIFGVLLGASGFEANVLQSEETQHAIKAIMALIPILGLTLCGAIMWNYPLDQKRHAELLTDLKIRRAAVPAAETSKTLTRPAN